MAVLYQHALDYVLYVLDLGVPVPELQPRLVYDLFRKPLRKTYIVSADSLCRLENSVRDFLRLERLFLPASFEYYCKHDCPPGYPRVLYFNVFLF